MGSILSRYAVIVVCVLGVMLKLFKGGCCSLSRVCFVSMAVSSFHRQAIKLLPRLQRCIAWAARDNMLSIRS